MKDKMINALKERKLVSFSIVWFVFSIALFIKNYAGEVGVINSSMMAFSYKYGFISRGLIGTIYKVLNRILPFEMMDYSSLLKFTVLMAVCFILLLFVFFVLCLVKCRKEGIEELKYIILFYSIFAVPMFVTYEHLGRLDIYCVMLSLLAAISLIIEKMEWVVVPFSAFGVMVHQGNVFMFLNIILVLLIYKAITSEKNRKKYLILFGTSFIVASILFLYFEFFSHSNGSEIYENVVTTATMLGKDGGIHRDVIDHEILGIDLSYREIPFRFMNLVEFPIYLVLMSPYIVLAVQFFKRIISAAKTKNEKIKYLLVAIGAGTMLPMLILKCDYGRWMFAIISYYCITIIALVGMKDEIVTTELKHIMVLVKEKWVGSVMLLVYPILLTPFLDIEITYVVTELAGLVNRLILHWW